MSAQPLLNEIKETKSLLAVYDQTTGIFSCHKDLIAYFGGPKQGQDLPSFLTQRGIATPNDVQELLSIVDSLNEENPFFYKEYVLGGTCLHAFTFSHAGEKVTVTLHKVHADCAPKADALTGLSGRAPFCRAIEELNADKERSFVLFFFDVIKLKAINDIFGFHEGDKLLGFIGERLRTSSLPIVAACRDSADRFAFLAECKEEDADGLISSLLTEIRTYELPFEINCNFGVYAVPKTDEEGNSMLDKAMLAQSIIKGSYTQTVHHYTEALRDDMLSEQEIVGSMNIALAEEQFLVYYQPQYNHSTGMLIGAEALVRWSHPAKGLISPARFIPIFEKNGFITRLDFYVFERAVRFIRRSMDEKFSIVPISINFSKNDIFAPNFVETLEEIRQKYDVPSKYLRIELTESILIGNKKTINDTLDRLHSFGYIIEMDDFGSGYSSLNVLKDLEFDIIKLDMLFLEDQDGNSRGGTILSSVVNMAKWLNIPIIAEGVETVEQADFLRSIGCDYIQGYLYSRPLPEKDYATLVSASQIGALIPQMRLADHLNSANFWNPSSQETLIFSNFVGAAAIFSYNLNSNSLEIMRVNKKYLQELGMNLSERDIIHNDPSASFDEQNKAIFMKMLHKAIESGEEQECETWRDIQSPCCGTERICIRTTATVIGQSDNQVLFYSMIRNVTPEKAQVNLLLGTEKMFKMASEQVNIYFWEYTISTKEMKPCFRCMRDLGLPPLVRNYPEPAIEQGIFPPEVADMYRDWHVQIANGVKELEAIIPLTMNRVPFRVRYTTEFDENGHPVKAYGSAALVVE